MSTILTVVHDLPWDCDVDITQGDGSDISGIWNLNQGPEQ